MVSATRRAFTILCLCAFGTIACDDYRPYKPWFRDTIGWNEEHILYDGHAEPRIISVAPLYCYRTIGAVDCSERPLVGQEQRLVGYFGPYASAYSYPFTGVSPTPVPYPQPRVYPQPYAYPQYNIPPATVPPGTSPPIMTPAPTEPEPEF